MLSKDQVDWNKVNGMLPTVVQHAFDGRVLMVAYMSPEALDHTMETGNVTFFSRSRNTLWTKGESSGNTLRLVSLRLDCDSDTLLVMAEPAGPTCHTGTDTCFDGEDPVAPALAFLATLERVIGERAKTMPEGSYTTTLFEAGVKRIAQKVGEEGVETALAATAGDDEEVLNESADLVYHLLVLLRARELNLDQLVQTLEDRHG